jgi:hypothetical protein
MSSRLVLNRRLLFTKPLKRIHVPDLVLRKSHSCSKAIHGLQPIQAGMTLPPTLPLSLPLVREPRPAQFTLGFSELEWLGYKAWCQEGIARGQLLPDVIENHSQFHESQPETLKKGPTLGG